MRPVRAKVLCGKQDVFFLLLPLIGRTMRGVRQPRVSPHSVRLALGYGLTGPSARHSSLTKSELVKIKSQLIKIVSKVRGMRSVI